MPIFLAKKMAKAKKPKYQDLSVNSFDPKELFEGVRQNKNKRNQAAMDEKVKKMEEELNKTNTDDKN